MSLATLCDRSRPGFDRQPRAYPTQGIVEAVQRGATAVEEIKKLVDFPEYQLRNRIHFLIKDRRLKRRPRARSLILRAP